MTAQCDGYDVPIAKKGGFDYYGFACFFSIPYVLFFHRSIGISPSSLNVLPTIPPNVLNSIRQLPEVEATLSSTVFSSPSDEK